MKVEFDFVKASEKRPEKSGMYLCACVSCGLVRFTSLLYSKKHDAFNASDEEEKPEHAIKPDFWAEADDQDERFGGGMDAYIHAVIAKYRGDSDV